MTIRFYSDIAAYLPFGLHCYLHSVRIYINRFAYTMYIYIQRYLMNFLLFRLLCMHMPLYTPHYTHIYIYTRSYISAFLRIYANVVTIS